MLVSYYAIGDCRPIDRLFYNIAINIDSRPSKRIRHRDPIDRTSDNRRIAVENGICHPGLRRVGSEPAPVHRCVRVNSRNLRRGKPGASEVVQHCLVVNLLRTAERRRGECRGTAILDT